MLRALIAILVLGAIGALGAGAVWLLQPKTSLYHPDFGADCRELLTVDTENAVDCVRVFYGTNRNVQFDGEAPAPDSEIDTGEIVAEDSQQLHLGRADVWLPRLIEEGGTRERGETPYLEGEVPEEDSELVKYVFLTRITKAGRAHFLADLDDVLIDQDSYSALLFVHGFNTPFEDALIRSAQLSVDLSRRDVFDVGVPLLFSWPSAGKVSYSEYRGDQDRSIAAAPYLEEFLDLIVENADIDRINIVAHSMGNRILTKALEDYAADYLERQERRDIEFRIVLVAADVDRDIFDGITGVLDNLEANVTIYTSDADRALHVSEIVNQNLRLGDTDGNRPYIRRNDYYETVDASGVATELFGLGHNYYSDNPFILGDMLCAMAEHNPEDRALEERRYADTPEGDPYFRVSTDIAPGYEGCSLFRTAFPLEKASQAPADESPMRIFAPPASPPPPPPPPPSEPRAAMPAEEIELTIPVEDRDDFNAWVYGLRVLEASEGRGISAIRIVAHTDTIGEADANGLLSFQWANAVKDYLVEQGIDESLISAEGRGESQPAISTEDDVAEPQNRRIEIVIEFE
ncbi:alpha/beta hydrolase [Henriciella sp.]|uniref:alpha/beta hydrolase n=1 Tax=Henriciella sp. TaxID=1968823 RepID=UPI00260F2763|nr:alpha/beta hydrolase [Henriciella sp.]